MIIHVQVNRALPQQALHCFSAYYRLPELLCLLAMVKKLMLVQESVVAALEERAADPHGTSARSASDAVQLAAASEHLLQDIRAFGRLPKDVKGSSEAQVHERSLAQRLRKARLRGKLSDTQESELASLDESATESIKKARILQQVPTDASLGEGTDLLT